MTTEAASITRSAGGDLALINSTYAVRELRKPRRKWATEMGGSRFVDGETQIGRRRTNSEIGLDMRVTATSHALLRTAMEDLLDAFDQPSFTFTYSLDSVGSGWSCFQAEVDGEFTVIERLHYCAFVLFTIPCKPIPTGGPW